MGRLSTISVLLAVGGYGVLFFGWGTLHNAGLSFTEVWLPSKRSDVVSKMKHAPICSSSGGSAAGYSGSGTTITPISTTTGPVPGGGTPTPVGII